MGWGWNPLSDIKQAGSDVIDGGKAVVGGVESGAGAVWGGFGSAAGFIKDTGAGVATAGYDAVKTTVTQTPSLIEGAVNEVASLANGVLVKLGLAKPQPTGSGSALTVVLILGGLVVLGLIVWAVLA